MKKLCCLVLSILMLCLCASVFTVYGVQTQKITVDYSTSEEKLDGAVFHVYRLGEVKGNRIIPNDTFSPYRINLDVSDTEKMTSLAYTVSAYILRDDITPLYTDTSDKNGIVDFDGAAFETGAYIIMADKHRQNESTYFCDPTLFILPYGNKDTVIIKPKYEVIPDNTETVSVSYKVLKAWLGTDYGGEKPVEIEVELLRDGDIYDTVVLNESNNWRFQWDDLSAFYHWTVAEKYVVDGYVVSLSRYERSFLLTNSVKKFDGGEAVITTEPTTDHSEITTSPDGATLPNTSETTSSGDMSNTDGTTETHTTGTHEQEPELPATGMLRWPIPYLAIVGMFLLIVGYAKYRKSELEDE